MSYGMKRVVTIHLNADGLQTKEAGLQCTVEQVPSELGGKYEYYAHEDIGMCYGRGDSPREAIEDLKAALPGYIQAHLQAEGKMSRTMTDRLAGYRALIDIDEEMLKGTQS